MSPDEQEAQSRKYGNDIVILLPLKSGNLAVFNAARELCGIVDEDKVLAQALLWSRVWRAPAPTLSSESYRTMKEEDADELLREAGL